VGADFAAEAQSGRRAAVYLHFNPLDNPHIDRAALLALKFEVDERTYQVEVLGMFLASGKRVAYNWNRLENERPTPTRGDVTDAHDSLAEEGDGIAQVVGLDVQRIPYIGGPVYRFFGRRSRQRARVDRRRSRARRRRRGRFLRCGLRDAGYLPESTLIVCDASGRWQHAVAAPSTRRRPSGKAAARFDIIRGEGYTRIVVPPDRRQKRNPHIVDRVRAFTSMICAGGVRRLFCDPVAAPRTAKALREWKTVNGAASRSQYEAHLGDGASYPIIRFFPRRLPTIVHRRASPDRSAATAHAGRGRARASSVANVAAGARPLTLGSFRPPPTPSRRGSRGGCSSYCKSRGARVTRARDERTRHTVSTPGRRSRRQPKLRLVTDEISRVKPTRRSVIVPVRGMDTYNSNPRSASPPTCSCRCTARPSGRPLRQYDAFERYGIEPDGHLRGLIDGRIESVAGSDWVLKPGRADKAERDGSRRARGRAPQRDDRRPRLRCLGEQPATGGFREVVEHHLTAPHFGIACTNIVWDIEAGSTSRAVINAAHRRFAAPSQERAGEIWLVNDLANALVELEAGLWAVARYSQPQPVGRGPHAHVHVVGDVQALVDSRLAGVLGDVRPAARDRLLRGGRERGVAAGARAGRPDDRRGRLRGALRADRDRHQRHRPLGRQLDGVPAHRRSRRRGDVQADRRRHAQHRRRRRRQLQRGDGPRVARVQAERADARRVEEMFTRDIGVPFTKWNGLDRAAPPRLKIQITRDNLERAQVLETVGQVVPIDEDQIYEEFSLRVAARARA
jgi:hypothetical protein